MPDLGDLATPTLTVSPFDGTTATTLQVTLPDATTSNPATSTADGGATWTATVTYTQVGWWRFKWTVSGTGAGIQYQETYVSAAPSTSDSERLIVPLEQFKRWIRVEGNDRDDDVLDVLVAATEWVEWKIGGPITPTTFTETAKVNGYAYIPKKRPLVSVASVTPDLGTAIDPSRYQVDTTVNMIRFRFGVFSGWYTFVYDAGLTTVKRMHTYAGRELARHLWKAQNGTRGRGSTDDDDIPTPLGFAVPNRVDQMLTPESVPGFA